MKQSRIQWYVLFLVLAACAVVVAAIFVPVYPAPPGPTAGEDRVVQWLVPLTPSPPGAKEEETQTTHSLAQSREVLASRSWAVDTVAYSVVSEEALARDLQRFSEAVAAEPGFSTLVRRRVGLRDLSERGAAPLREAVEKGSLFDAEGTEPTPIIYVPDPASIHPLTVDGIAFSAPLMELRTLPWPSAVATAFSVPPLFFHLQRPGPPQSGLEYVPHRGKGKNALAFSDLDQLLDEDTLGGWRRSAQRINRQEEELRPKAIWGGTLHARIKTLSINPRLTLVQVDLLDRAEILDQFRYLALPFADALPIEDRLQGSYHASMRLDVNTPAVKRRVSDVDLWRIPHRGWPHRIQTPAWEAGLLDIPEQTLVPIGGKGPPLRDQQRFALPDFASLLDPPILLIRWRDDARPGAERYVVEQWHPDTARDLDLRMVVIFANVTDETLASFVAWAHAPS